MIPFQDMGHGHHHHHHFPGHESKESKNILIAFFLNFSFAIVELIGGFYTNSMAIKSDALHDFGDSLALLFAYVGERISRKKSDKNFTFGYRRFALLATAVNGVILFLGSLFIIYGAIDRIFDPEPVKAQGMLGLAFLGIFVNSIAAFRLSKGDGLNSKMVMLHLLEDILGWVAVLIVSVILFYKPWYILDPLLSIMIALIILRGVYRNLIKVGMIFLQRFPSELELEEIRNEITELEGVVDIHEVKGWSIDESTYYLRFHVTVPKQTLIEELDSLKKQIKGILEEKDVRFSTIEFESAAYDCNDH